MAAHRMVWHKGLQRCALLTRKLGLAVTQFLTRLRYHDPKLFQLLGGRKAMIESPLLNELKAEWTRDLKAEWTRRDILKILEARFGIAARALEAELKTVRRGSARRPSFACRHVSHARVLPKKGVALKPEGGGEKGHH